MSSTAVSSSTAASPPCRAPMCSRRARRRVPRRRGGGPRPHIPGGPGGSSASRAGRAGPRSGRAPMGPRPVLSFALRFPSATNEMLPSVRTRRRQDGEAAVISPLRCMPDPSPSLGASRKGATLPTAVETQDPPPSEVARMVAAGYWVLGAAGDDPHDGRAQVVGQVPADGRRLTCSRPPCSGMDQRGHGIKPGVRAGWAGGTYSRTTRGELPCL